MPVVPTALSWSIPNAWIPSAVVIWCAVSLAYIHCQLAGTIARCDLESGTPVSIPGISDDSCISCTCQDKEVACKKEECPDLHGCRVIPYGKPKDQCCDECKGCFFRGRHYPSNTTWKDTKKPCLLFSCVAGVLTESVIQCHLMCKNPTIILDRCCPLCPGCQVEGTSYQEGDIFLSSVDKCSVCRCENSSVSCERYGCPVPNCSKRHLRSHDNATCCSTCVGTRRVYEPPRGACLFRNKVFFNGSVTQLDKCTSCICLAGTMHCTSKICPLLYCQTDDVIVLRKSCCARCRVPKRGCRERHRSYKHGLVWKSDQCTHCLCDDGTIRCHVQRCSWRHLECPPNTKAVTEIGDCCPHCVDVEAVCAVFGDPHYRTFDGRLFNFQGTCNYILAEECARNSTLPSFSIRVRNEARLSPEYAWTKSVTIHFADSKIYLLRNYRVKVDREKVQLPYLHWTNMFKLTSSSNSVTWVGANGVKVIWDGNSYVEVSVPAIYKGKMCGLCGNYNNLEHDDFTDRNGRLLHDSAIFGHAWQVDGAGCRHGSETTSGSAAATCSSSEARRRRATKQCGVLYEDAFDQCRSVISVQDFYVSCVTDVCDCPRGKQCACESVTAYSRACSREGIEVEGEADELCGVTKCPTGSRWHACASQCRLTCRNHRLLSVCELPCQPGCQCRPGFVYHGNRCIHPTKCPIKTKKKAKKKKKNKRRKFDGFFL